MDEIRDAIYQATGVYVDGAAVADEIREAISSSGAEAGRQWITGQDDPLARWEYFVDYSRDDELDENGDLIQSDETIRLLEISIFLRSASTSFAKAGLPLNKEFYVSLDVEI